MNRNYWREVADAVDRAIYEIEFQLDRDVPQGQLKTDMERDVELLKAARRVCMINDKALNLRAEK